MSKLLTEELIQLERDLKRLKKELFIEMITEGVDDPGILKCVFLAGGPGSGKSYTAKEIFGVGKTAIIEGLAQRIYHKDVPESLVNCKIFELDMME